MLKEPKEITLLKAEAVKIFIADNRDRLIQDEGIINIEVPKSDYKNTEKIFREVLGNEYMRFIHFKIRKKTKEEINLLLMMVLTPLLIVVMIVGVVLMATGILDGIYKTFFMYLCSLIGLLFSINALKFAFKLRKTLFLLFILVLIFMNGYFFIGHMSDLFN